MRKARRGMVLVTVMFFILVIGLFGRIMLINGPGMAQMANQSGAELQAQRAAEAGASYVRMMLRDNGDWMGDANAVTVNLPNLKIEEQNGNVIGWIKGGGEEVSMFRVRFNYQDGSPGADTLADPPAAFVNDTVYLSVNNVRNNNDAPVPDVNPSTFVVDDPAVGALTVPRGSAFIRVEGWAGTALRDTTGPGDSPNPGGRLISRVLRVVYKAAPDQNIPDEALSAGNGIELEVENRADFSIVGGDGQAKIRSKQGIDVHNPAGSDTILSMEGSASRDPGQGLNALVDSTKTLSETDETVGDGNDFHNLSWDDVPKAGDTTSPVELPGGIYVAASDGRYHYYDMTLAEYESIGTTAGGTINATTGVREPTGALATRHTVLSSNFSEQRTDGGTDGISVSTDVPYVLTIDKDVNFTTSANGQSDVLFTTVKGRKLHKNDTSSPYEFSGVNDFLNAPGAMLIDNAIISSPGDLGIMVDIKGENASLTAENNAIIAAPSVALTQDAAVEFDQRLSIYAKGDLSVSTYRDTPGYPPYVPPYEGYNNLNVEGLVYAWGDANIYTGTPGETYTDQVDIYNSATLAPNYAEANITGALVAYGGDPSAFDSANPLTGPGSGGNGKISVYGMAANIVYDATKLVADPASLPAAGLPAVTRVSYGFEN